MKKALLLLTLVAAACAQPGNANTELPNWEQRARNVTITRDDWGIAHIRGRTDADAVFGMMYAQAEDDFNRVEMNFINSMGRLAETEGESAIFRDLRMKLFINPDSIRAQYETSPPWLTTLMIAWADGLNFYLSTHPEVRPKVITRFEPWMALTFSEGSIGGDIERVSIPALRALYGSAAERTGDAEEEYLGDGTPREPSGSNGIAIAPSNTVAGRSLLLINPHTSFFFRSEQQVTSEEGLNAYGASTWGQFFIYQGFNEKAGWMHTSSNADNIDDYLLTTTRNGDSYTYMHGTGQRPVITQKIVVPYKTPNGMARREFDVYRTHHGPVVRSVDGQWVAVRLMEEPVKALTQSYARTKATDYKSFLETMRLHTNSSNNTIFADASGNIAYFHANFVPKRNARFDFTRPVDGSDPGVEWIGTHGVEESPHVLNPSTGWLYNTNNFPYSAAGVASPKQSAFPNYMDRGTENPRGIHAIRVLENRKDFTIASLIAAAYDSYLPAFESMVPQVVAAYDAAPASHPLKAKLREQVGLLRAWDFRWATNSVPTSLAVFFGDELARSVASAAARERIPADDYAARSATPEERLLALSAATDKLTADFGTWKTPWGEINRFQRLTADIVHPFDDKGTSIPVGFTSARWGSLASFGARSYPGTKKWYGTSGNSFVAVVEFGDSVRARAVSAGGEHGNPTSKHFNDQAQRYSTGDLREVYFYPSQLKGHTVRTYRPGEKE